MPLQIRRGPTADRTAIIPLLGELVYDTETGAVYVGDGTTPGGIAVTVYSGEDARNNVIKLFLGESGTDNSVHSGVTYQYIGQRLVTTIEQADLSNYNGIIKANGFLGNLLSADSTTILDAETGTLNGHLRGDVNGSVYSDNSTQLIDGVQGIHRLDGTVGTDIVPNADSTFDLGSPSHKFKDLYLSGSSLHLGNATITSTGTAVNLPAGSTVNGTAIGTGVIKASMLPDVSETYDIGDLTHKFRKLYLKEGGNLYLGNAVLSSSGTTIDLPAGSTVNGIAIGTGGIVVGDTYYINIKASDTATIVDSVTKTFYGTLVGNADSATTAGSAGTVTVAVSSATNADYPVTFVTSASGTLIPQTDAGLTYNPNSNTLTTNNVVALTSIFGNLNGNVVGDVQGTLTGSVIGNLKGSVFADDSSLIINGQTGTIPANVIVGNASGLTGLTTTGTIYATNNGSPGTTMLGLSLAYNTGADGSLLTFRKSRGTIASPTAVQTSDIINSMVGLGYDGTGFTTATSILTRAVGTISTGIVPGQIEIATADDTGTLTNRIIADQTGLITFAGSTRNIINVYSSSVSLASFQQYHETADAVNFTFARGRGTFASPNPIQNGDDIIDIVFSGNNSAGNATAVAAITVSVSGAVGTQVPGKMTIAMNNGTSAADRFVFENTGIMDFKSTGLVAGVGSGQVNTSSVTTYMQVKLNGTAYAIPLYSINP